MRLSNVFSRVALAAALVLGLPHQQWRNPAEMHSPQGVMGNDVNNSDYNTGSQTRQITNGNAPVLQGATNGTVGPQGDDATAIMGVNTTGTVRVSNLANLEALLSIIANGSQILGTWGGRPIMGFMHMAAGTPDAMREFCSEPLV
ncbi:MAG: hypothetical protein R3C24_08075 [Cyanobacteriota/Melainabacteria group bacterium]